MTPCTSCLHYSECMEQRGRCREYKDLEEVRKEIEMLNKAARLAKRTGADEAAEN